MPSPLFSKLLPPGFKVDIRTNPAYRYEVREVSEDCLSAGAKLLLDHLIDRAGATGVTMRSTTTLASELGLDRRIFFRRLCELRTASLIVSWREGKRYFICPRPEEIPDSCLVKIIPPAKKATSVTSDTAKSCNLPEEGDNPENTTTYPPPSVKNPDSVTSVTGPVSPVSPVTSVSGVTKEVSHMTPVTSVTSDTEQIGNILKAMGEREIAHTYDFQKTYVAKNEKQLRINSSRKELLKEQEEKKREEKSTEKNFSTLYPPLPDPDDQEEYVPCNPETRKSITEEPDAEHDVILRDSTNFVFLNYLESLTQDRIPVRDLWADYQETGKVIEKRKGQVYARQQFVEICKKRYVAAGRRQDD